MNVVDIYMMMYFEILSVLKRIYEQNIYMIDYQHHAKIVKRRAVEDGGRKQ